MEHGLGKRAIQENHRLSRGGITRHRRPADWTIDLSIKCTPWHSHLHLRLSPLAAFFFPCTLHHSICVSHGRWRIPPAFLDQFYQSNRVSRTLERNRVPPTTPNRQQRMSNIAFSQETRNGTRAAPRDSLELASLASSSPVSVRGSSRSSSPNGISSSRKLSLEDEDPLAEPQGDDYLESGRHRSLRSYSVSSAFDFGGNLFPLSQTQAGYAPLGTPTALNQPGDASLERNKTLTYLNGMSLIVGLIIGSGIFSSPSQVNANAGSPGASLIVWAVAGVLAWTGAASYAELGGAIPLNGGSQVYLAKIFGEMMGFLFTWCAVLVLKPGSAAIISIIFGEYVVRAFVGADVATINPWINKGVAFGGLLIVTLFNCVSTKFATRIGDLFMFFKFVALVGVTVTGIVVAVTGFSSKGSASEEWKNKGWFEGTNTEISDFAVALYAGLWAFDGWDNVRKLSPRIGSVLILFQDKLCDRRI